MSQIRCIAPPLLPLVAMQQKGRALEKLAQVECRRCHRTRWVSWDYRHDGKRANTEHYKDVCCQTCPTGLDFTAYTGRMRLWPEEEL